MEERNNGKSKKKVYLYLIRKKEKTRILKIDRLEALNIIEEYGDKFDLGIFHSYKVYREYSPYIKVNNLKELFGNN
jgi:hypothetical protein